MIRSGFPNQMEGFAVNMSEYKRKAMQTAFYANALPKSLEELTPEDFENKLLLFLSFIHTSMSSVVSL